MPSGVYRKKTRPSPSLEITSFFRFSRRPPCGGIIASLLLGGRGRAALFSFSRSLCSRVCVFYSDMRQQVPKPMNEFAFEGELLAAIENGDRTV